MTNYTKATNFAAKDSLASGNAAKVVKGTEIDTEFTNIETAVNSKSDSANPVFTGVAEFADGSASAPSITNTGDTNTGMFFPAADTIAFAEGGTETMRLDSAGNMGLGVTPSAWDTLRAFDIGSGGALWGTAAQVGVGSNVYYGTGNFRYKATNVAAALQVDGNVFKFLTAASGTAGNAITFTQAMTLDASGNLGVGTTSPSTRLHLYGASNEMLRLESSSTSYDAALRIFQNGTQITNLQGGVGVTGGGTFLTTVTSAPLVFGTANTERARIDSSGNLLIGQTSGTQRISLTSAVDAYAMNINALKSGNTNYYMMLIRANGATVGEIYSNGSTTTYATSSDYRLKNIDGYLTGYKERLMALQPKQGTWKVDGSEFRGFLAHEFASQYPMAVNGEKDAVDEEGNAKYQSMQASGAETIADLVALAQEQQAIIEQLQADVAALKGQV